VHCEAQETIEAPGTSKLRMKAREHRVDTKWRRRWWDAGRVPRDRCRGRGSKDRRKRDRAIGAIGAGGAVGKMLMVRSIEEVRLISSE
jgi:hypothetical protein